MKFLILGGTQMLGRAFVEDLKQKYQNITLANRNITNPFLFTDLKKIIIDRNNPESCLILKKEKYDITIDFSCYNVDQFKNVYSNLNTEKYIYISTMSVLNIDKKSKEYNYALNKFLIEEYIKNNLKKCLIIRPCAVYGDNDYTNRFYKENNIFFWKNTQEKAENGCVSVQKFVDFLNKNLPINFDLDNINIINII